MQTLLFPFATSNLPFCALPQVLSSPVLCSALFCSALPCFLPRAVLSRSAPSHSVLSCSALLCSALICSARLCPALPCPARSCPILSCTTLSWHAHPCPAQCSTIFSITLSALLSILICPFPLSAMLYRCYDLLCTHPWSALLCHLICPFIYFPALSAASFVVFSLLPPPPSVYFPMPPALLGHPHCLFILLAFCNFISYAMPLAMRHILPTSNCSVCCFALSFSLTLVVQALRRGYDTERNHEALI